jgi:hypothetical protein
VEVHDRGVDAPRDIECWSAAQLVALTPGATRWQWYGRLIPALEKRGTLRRVGRVWLGRREEILAALVPTTKWDVSP